MSDIGSLIGSVVIPLFILFFLLHLIRKKRAKKKASLEALPKKMNVGSSTSKGKLVGYWVIGGIGGLVLLGMVMPERPEALLYEAEEICKDFVRDSLKSPSGATFENHRGPAAILMPDGTYEVLSWVEAENSFNAKVRQNYSCNITRWPNGKWTLNKLEM